MLLWGSLRSRPRDAAVSIAGSVLFAAAVLASAVVLGRVTDRVVAPALKAGESSAAALAAAAAAIVGVGVAKSLGIVLRRVWAYKVQLGLQAEHRALVGRRYQELSLSWHRRRRTGELLSHANADVEMMFWPMAPLPFAIGVSGMLLAALVMLAVTDWALAAVGALLVPAVLGVNAVYTRAAEEPARRAQQRRADTAAVAHEVIDGALVVKTLGREQAETDRFATHAARLRDTLVEVGRLRAVFTPVMDTLPQLGVLAILGVGAWRVAEGAVSTGEVVQFSYLLALIAFPVRMIGVVLEELPSAVAGAERVEGVLAAQEELPGGAGRELPAHGPAALSAHGVTFRFDPDADEAALKGVDLAVEPGRVVALVGPTGAGKSTLLALATRLHDPELGSLCLDGVALPDVASLHRHVAAAFQEPFLFDDTVRDNITLGEPATDAEVVAAAQLAQADAFIRGLPQGYDTLVGERGASLSGGQRQRIALARALVRRPRLLLLDDATSSVDPTVETAILAGLRQADLPATVLAVAQRRATIAVADEVIYLESGRVLARGTHEELMAVPGYRAIVQAASAGGSPA
jgi:ABC-type multidrug transport system fused ATPase/permease subunit